jgi:hypothetical protein
MRRLHDCLIGIDLNRYEKAVSNNSKQSSYTMIGVLITGHSNRILQQAHV